MSNCDIWVAITDQIAFFLSILSQPLGDSAANPSSWIGTMCVGVSQIVVWQLWRPRERLPMSFFLEGAQQVQAHQSHGWTAVLDPNFLNSFRLLPKRLCPT